MSLHLRMPTGPSALAITMLNERTLRASWEEIFHSLAWWYARVHRGGILGSDGFTGVLKALWIPAPPLRALLRDATHSRNYC